jgi:transposase InsO family protein
VQNGRVLLVPECADEPACLGAVEHDRRGLAVLEGAEPDERGLSGDSYLRAVLVRVDDQRRTELRHERGEGAARLRALLERARVVAEEKVDLAAAGEALDRGPLVRNGPVPVAIGSTRPDRKRATVGETAQATKTEACSARHVVQAEAERHKPGHRRAVAGRGERLGVVVVSVHEEKLEARAAQEGAGGAEEAAPFRLARQVAEVAERDERVAALLDGALDQTAEVASVAMHVAEDKQPAHSRRDYRARFCSRAEDSDGTVQPLRTRRSSRRHRRTADDENLHRLRRDETGGRHVPVQTRNRVRAQPSCPRASRRSGRRRTASEYSSRSARILSGDASSSGGCLPAATCSTSRRAGIEPPAVATIHRALRRNHLVAPQPPRRVKASKRFEREDCNERWQIDGTQVALAGGAPVWIVDCLDDHARFLLAAIAVDGPTGEAAWACFLAASAAYRLPRQLLSDNHLSFTGRLFGLTVAFERRLAEVGVELINAAPAHPQTLGKLERFHRTLKEWLQDEGPPTDLEHLQLQLDRFRAS